MGATSHSSRSLKVALSNATMSLGASEEPSNSSVSRFSTNQTQLCDSRNDKSRPPWELLSQQFEINRVQQTALKSRDVKISELQEENIKLKEKVKTLELKYAKHLEKCTFRMPIVYSEPSKTEHLLKKKAQPLGPTDERDHVRSEAVNNEKHDLDRPPILSPIVIVNSPPKRVTRTSGSFGSLNVRLPKLINNSNNSDSSDTDFFELPDIPDYPLKQMSPPRKAQILESIPVRLRNQSRSFSFKSSIEQGAPARTTKKDVTKNQITEKKTPVPNHSVVPTQRATDVSNRDEIQLRNSTEIQKPKPKDFHLTRRKTAPPYPYHPPPSPPDIPEPSKEKLMLRRLRRSGSTGNNNNNTQNNVPKRKSLDRDREGAPPNIAPKNKETPKSVIPKSPNTNCKQRRESEKNVSSLESTNSERRLSWESPLILNEQEDCMTTLLHYRIMDRAEELMDNNSYKSAALSAQGGSSDVVVEVPMWREKVITKSNYSHGVEDLDDAVFLKRHLKLEQDERRRKRWDAQRLREEQYLAKLKAGSTRRERSKAHKRRLGSFNSRGEIEEEENDAFYNEIDTFQPKLMNATCIRVKDDIPISVFGCPLPVIEPIEFKLPWDLKPRRPKRSRNEVYYKSHTYATSHHRPPG